MNELQRTEYLTALGVTSYMPRFRLPLAAEPIQAPLPPPAEEAPEAPPRAALMAEVAAPEQPAGDSADEVRSELAARTGSVDPAPELGRVIGSITSETRVTATAKAAPVAPPQQQVAPFVLSCWWLGEEVLAVDSREPGTALPVESLFGNIARALGWHQLPTGRDKLRWPLTENPFAAAAGADDARDTCSSWLEAACARKPVKSIWLMGEQAQSYCAPVTLDGPVNDWQGVSLVSMPSLTELLTQPARKREVWNLLRKLYPEQTRR
ncbi:hypothetical protein [Microbulbifer sp. YPW1]|uniref:hypothetical protein n=1 Tax=Microbulbifer sp. YPW1 TaxID=2745199 RepID=UPI001598BD0C|nr:hypothetical protein [Microbulbifer sp. YPW1]QKX17375.1 hypothetical protein HUW35_10425 [Microbulbifer sp. YPW1]